MITYFSFFILILSVTKSLSFNQNTISTHFSSFNSSFSNFSSISSKEYLLPNIIWLFWDGDISNDISFFLHNIKDKMRSYQIIFLTQSTINYYIETDDLYKLSSFNKANQADYYRFNLLHNYGGIWMDATIYLHNETFLNYLTEQMKEKQSTMGGFNYLFHPNYHIEVGFIMAPYKSLFIDRVLKEMMKCIKMGRTEYINKMIDEGIIIKSKEIVKYYEGKRIIKPYFYPYVCIQTVLQRDYERKANILLLRAEDYIYKLHYFCKWKTGCMGKELENKENLDKYIIIKFNRINRKNLTFPKVKII